MLGPHYEIHDRVFGAVAPTDFIEEIWVRDLVDATWAMSRLRRLLATFWTAEVSDDADQQAASRALAEAKLMEGAEKEEMNRLLDTKSGVSWQSLVEQNPRANEKFQALYSRASPDYSARAGECGLTN